MSSVARSVVAFGYARSVVGERQTFVVCKGERKQALALLGRRFEVK